jgi:mediator of RNA polymerase II transcription subunit 8
MGAYSKVVGHVWELVSKAREEWETEGNTRGGTAITSSMTDTHTLVAAVAMGKGLKVSFNLTLYLLTLFATGNNQK